jgi:hypothetical protein
MKKIKIRGGWASTFPQFLQRSVVCQKGRILLTYNARLENFGKSAVQAGPPHFLIFFDFFGRK